MDNNIKNINKRILGYCLILLSAVLFSIGLITSKFLWYSAIPAAPGIMLLVCRNRPHIKAFASLVLSSGAVLYYLTSSFLYAIISTAVFVILIFYIILSGKSKN